MKDTYIISDNKSSLKTTSALINIPEKQIIYFQDSEKESGYHDWVTGIFKENTIKKLIIPISIPTDIAINTNGLTIALHIRLNYELNLTQRLIPIVFLSDFAIDKLIRGHGFDTDNNPLNLLFTKGVYLSTYDKEDIINTILLAEPCNENEYRKQVLDKLKIVQKANTGKHSLANAWGCYKLSLVTGQYDKIIKHPGVSEQLKTLYAKYMICFNDTYKLDRFIDLTPIPGLGNKRILFIDDQADEGWAVLMKNIFKNAQDGFVFIDSSKYKNRETKIFHDFEGFYTECKLQIGKDWDLIIIDLRLHPEKEDVDSDFHKPKELSGYKLIDKFLSENAGNQIIVLTASNKIWNINVAIERGASAYYIKESPEFYYSTLETKKHLENLKDGIKKCFERAYLRNIYRELKVLELRIDSLTTYPPIFLNELKNQLYLAFDMLFNAKSKEQFAYAYVTLYLVIEVINKQFVTKISDGKWAIEGGSNLFDWTWNDGNRSYAHTGVEVIENKPPEWQKFAGVYFQKWNKTDPDFIQEIYFLIRKRNGFIHNDESILNKKDMYGNWINHDVFEARGFLKLFEYVCEIVNCL